MLPSGFRIGDHAIVRRVASGASCEVYEAQHVPSGEPVALKCLRDAECIVPELVSRFLGEAQILRELRHPHLVRALHFGVVPDGPPYVVLEWQPLDLHQALARKGGRFAPSLAARIAAQLAGALATLHERGLVHRDLKPANVLLSSENLASASVKLADLGLAKRLPDSAFARSGPPVSTARGVLLGTWDYMSPEQWVDSKTAGPEADVYGLGALLFQMLAGRLPFIAGAEKHLMYLHLLEPPPLEALQGFPSALVALVGQMMAKVPADRPSMATVKNELSDGSAAFRRLSW